MLGKLLILLRMNASNKSFCRIFYCPVILRSTMELYESLRTILILQKILRYSVVVFDKNGVRVSRPLTIFTFSLSAVLIFNYGRQLLNAAILFDQNPVDQSSFSSVVGIISALTIFVSMFFFWITVVLLRNQDIELLTLFQQFDSFMENTLDLQLMYGEFRKTSLKRLLATSVVPLTCSVPFYFSQDDGSYVFNAVLLATIGVSFMFCGVTFLFNSYILMVCDRYQGIAQSAAKIDRTIDLIHLMRAEKKLTMIVEKMNRTISVKQTFVLVPNWVVITVMSYMLLVATVFWTNNSVYFCFIIIPTAFPHLFMLYGSYYSGELLELSVRKFQNFQNFRTQDHCVRYILF